MATLENMLKPGVTINTSMSSWSDSPGSPDSHGSHASLASPASPATPGSAGSHEGELSEKIIVAVRVRPLTQKEEVSNQAVVWCADPDENRIWKPKATVPDPQRQAPEFCFGEFYFLFSLILATKLMILLDRVFIGPSTKTVYQEFVAPVVLSTMKGFNGI